MAISYGTEFKVCIDVTDPVTLLISLGAKTAKSGMDSRISKISRGLPTSSQAVKSTTSM